MTNSDISRAQPSAFFQQMMPIEIEITEDEYYATLIEEITDETIVLAMPMKGTQLKPIAPGLAVNLICSKRSNKYFFQTKVLRNSYEPEPVIVVERPADNTGAQLREYARIDVLIDGVQFWVEENGRFGETRTGTILDLSAGGARLQVKEPVEVGARLAVKFRLPQTDRIWSQPRSRYTPAKKLNPYRRKVHTGSETSSDELSLDADVVRCTAIEEDQARRYRLGIRWIAMTKAIQERIIRFVFQRELELRRRGAL